MNESEEIEYWGLITKFHKTFLEQECNLRKKTFLKLVRSQRLTYTLRLRILQAIYPETENGLKALRNKPEADEGQIQKG